MIPRLSRLRYRIPFWLALLALGLCGNAWADDAIGIWRSEVTLARILAENDTQAAYKEAQRLQANLPTDATPIDRVQLLNLLARTELYLAQTEAAAAYAQQAFDLAKQHADKVGQAEADLNVALIAINQGRIDEMTAAVTHSMTILDGVNRPDLLAEAMLRTAMMYRQQGQVDASVTMAMQTMEIARRSNNPVALAYAEQGMAFSFDQSESLIEARNHFMLMREQARMAHMRRLEAESLLGLGRVVRKLGNMPGAERLIREGIAMFSEIGNPYSVGHGLFALAENMQQQGRMAESLRLFNDVVATYRKYPNKIGLWWTLNARSTNYQSLGRIDDAEAGAEWAYALARNIGFSLYLSESAKRLAAISATRGDLLRAYKFSVKADEMAIKAARESASKHMVELAQRYETESKQRQIIELNRRNEVQTVELQKRRLQQGWLWTVLGSSIVILAGTAIFLLRLRRTHRQLQRSKNKLQAILDAIPDMLFELGLDGRYYDFHSLSSDLLVTSAEEFFGKTVLDVMPQYAAEICLAALHEAHEKGISTGRQFGLPLPQGMCWFELSVARKAMGQGEEPRFIVLSRDITERKRMETALRDSQQRYRDVFENVSDGLYLLEVTEDGRFRNIEINAALERSVGIRREAMIGKYVDETVSEEVGRAVVAKYRRCVEVGIPIDEEIELDLPTGLRTYHSTLIPVFDERGRIHRIAGVSRDITVQRQAELLLEQQLELKAQLARIAMVAPGVICSFQLVPGGIMRLVYASPRLEEVTGLSIEAQSRGIFHAIHPDDQDSYLDSILASVSTSSPWYNEFRVIHPNKGEIWLEVRCIPERQPDGGYFWHGFLHDITERKQLEGRLLASEQEFRTLAEHSPDNISRYDLQCRMHYINPSLEKALGKCAQELLGKTPMECKPDAHAYQAKIEDVIRTGHDDEIEVTLSNVGESLRYHHIRFVAERGPNGEIVGALAMGRDVTEHRRLQYALEKHERQLRTLVENLPDFVMRLDIKGRYLYVSPAVSKAFGVPVEHYIGKTAVDIGITGDMVSDLTLLDYALNCAREGVPTTLEMTFRHQYGDRVFDIVHVPERDEFGNIESVLSVARDITSLQTAHHELKKKEALLRSLIDSIPDLIFFKSIDLVYLGFNKAFAEYCGYSEAQLIGKTDYDFAPMDVADFFRQKDREMLADVMTRHNDEWVEYPDGRRILLDTLKTPLYGSDGEVIGVIGVSRDITERHRMEQALIRRELEFRTLAENSPDVIVRYDLDCRRVYINRAYMVVVGMVEADVLGKTPMECWQLVLPTAEEYTACLQNVMKTGETDELLAVQINQEGLQAHYTMSLVPEFDEKNRVVSVLTIGHDITELKATERLLEESQRLLRQLAARSEDAREDERKYLAREIHDELGQYLMALRMGVSVVGLKFGENNLPLQEKIDHLIELVDSTIQVVREVVSSLRPKALDLGIVLALEWLVEEYQKHTKTRCELHVRGNDIYLDDKRATAIFRIVQESLTNMGRHAKASKVDIVLEQKQDQYILQVRDNGKGFDPAVRKDKSFGLVGMRERALSLGGEVEISSVPGHGTVIKVCIPVNNVWSEEE